MVTASVLLALHEGPMGHDRLEAAMFWVGAMLAFMPVLVLSGVLLYVRWRKKKLARMGAAPAPVASATAERETRP
jgi:hypothetical protein